MSTRTLWIVGVMCGVLWSAGDALAEPVLTTAIAPQPLPKALAAFVEQSSLQLIYVSALAEGKQSRGAPAGLTAHQALAQLLDGTGLGFEFLNERTVRLSASGKDTVGGRPVKARSTNRVPSQLAWQSTDELDEILVSATKREEPLRLVPISASVLSADAMAATGIKGITEIGAVVPGVEYDFSAQWGAGIYTNLAIRGIGSDKGDPTTGLYVDDTPIHTPHTSFRNPYPFSFDLQRVEILRGPQGVLFGRSAEGGAIRFITKAPSASVVDATYHAEVSTTERGELSYETGAAVGGPLVQSVLGARVSAWYRSDAGYIDRVDPFTGATVDEHSNSSVRKALRVGLVYEPTDGVRITPSFAYQTARIRDAPVFYAYLSDPNAGLLNNGRLLRQPAADSLTIGSLKLEAPWRWVNLTAVAAYVDRTATALVDNTNEAGALFFGGFGNPLGAAFPSSYADAVPTQLAVHQIQVSQELRWASIDTGAPLVWIAGLFFAQMRQDDSQYTALIVAPSLPGLFNYHSLSRTELSGFGQVTRALSRHWSVGLGLRLGRSYNDETTRAGGFANVGAAAYAHSSGHETLPPTPRFELSYKPDSNQFIYAAIAKGFRSGGGNGIPLTPCGASFAPSSYGPDSVWSFEVGAKTSFFNRRLHINASLFDVRWHDIQQHVFDPCGDSFTTNVGAAASDGFDLEAEASLSTRLHLALAVGYLNVRYTKSVMTPDGRLIAERGTVVGGLPAVPAPWNGTVTASYQWPLAGRVAAYARAQAIVHSHNPGPFTELDPRAMVYDPRFKADPATKLFNMHWGLTWSELDVELFVNNALNSQPVLQRNADVPGSPLLYDYTFRPRTWGLSGTWKH